MDPQRDREGTHGTEQLAVGRDAGQRRQSLVSGRSQRSAWLLPVPGPLRKLCPAGSIRARPEHRLGRADQDRRHPGGTAWDSHAGWLTGVCHGRRRERDLSGGQVAERSRWRLSARRSRGSHREKAPAGQDRRAHPAAERLSGLRVHSISGSAVSTGGRHDRSGRDDLHRRHVPRHDRRGRVGEAGHLPSRKDQPVSARQSRGAWPRLAFDVRRDRARSDASADAGGNASAARGAPRTSERLVARYCAAAPGAEAGQVRRARAPVTGQDVEESAGAFPCAVDARGARRPGRRR